MLESRSNPALVIFSSECLVSVRPIVGQEVDLLLAGADLVNDNREVPGAEVVLRIQDIASP